MGYLSIHRRIVFTMIDKMIRKLNLSDIVILLKMFQLPRSFNSAAFSIICDFTMEIGCWLCSSSLNSDASDEIELFWCKILANNFCLIPIFEMLDTDLLSAILGLEVIGLAYLLVLTLLTFTDAVINIVNLSFIAVILSLEIFIRGLFISGSGSIDTLS